MRVCDNEEMGLSRVIQLSTMEVQWDIPNFFQETGTTSSLPTALDHLSATIASIESNVVKESRRNSGFIHLSQLAKALFRTTHCQIEESSKLPLDDNALHARVTNARTNRRVVIDSESAPEQKMSDGLGILKKRKSDENDEVGNEHLL